jgi:hypothetical protein
MENLHGGSNAPRGLLSLSSHHPKASLVEKPVNVFSRLEVLLMNEKGEAAAERGSLPYPTLTSTANPQASMRLVLSGSRKKPHVL